MGVLFFVLSMIAIVYLIVFLFMGFLSIFKETGKEKKYFKFSGISMLLTILFFIIFSVSSEEPKSASKETVEETDINETTEDETVEDMDETEYVENTVEEVVQTPKDLMYEKIAALIETKKAFDTGSYIQGEIPKGEYAFISFEGSGEYYSEEDPSGNIIDNENFDSFGYVYVHDAGNIETQGALINVSAFSTLGVSGAKEVYEIMNEVEDYKDAGWYKVGLDIPAGKYTAESYGEGYVAVMAGPVGKSDIVDNENFNGKHMVNVVNGQYLNISNGFISQ